jgi:hypothetical protein
VLHFRLIILLLGCDVPIDNDVLLVTDFINLKIKSVQSFRGAHTDRVYVYIFIRVSAHTCMNIYIYTVFSKKHMFSSKLTRIYTIQSSAHHSFF